MQTCLWYMKHPYPQMNAPKYHVPIAEARCQENRRHMEATPILFLLLLNHCLAFAERQLVLMTRLIQCTWSESESERQSDTRSPGYMPGSVSPYCMCKMYLKTVFVFIWHFVLKQWICKLYKTFLKFGSPRPEELLWSLFIRRYPSFHTLSFNISLIKLTFLKLQGALKPVCMWSILARMTFSFIKRLILSNQWT